MIVPDPLSGVITALGRVSSSSSDFDLNPDVILPEGRSLRPAGVLIGFVERAGGVQVILTKRSSALRHHPGQIAFPGGKQDEGDSDVIATALREAHEEVGLHPDMTQVLGTFPCHETVTSFTMTPVLARVDPAFRPVSEPGEVEEVFEVPLTHLADPANYLVQSRQWRGQRRHYFVVPYGPYYIWGATARILRGLADRMAG
ncbi:8-oxo-dGTP pyrophosphatase MutT, NUDIX family [Thalassovita taeanensis]|uniref:8-oxo-dGTP pyrophosphatase MutT, NUDIX family n=1 Tax=Thalassovita taeanensis TaxID=657014 RepID=A0A1H9JL09_9RHOB|nr:8-oxo-dGTP pyrophosphatase MutT, NUDIX family [Thalassovita taeanensis]